MLKIRVKGKHILAVLLLFVLAVVMTYAYLPKWLFDRASTAQTEEKREAYYDYLIKKFPNTDEGIRALFFSAQNEVSRIGSGEEPGLIYLFPTFTQMSGEPVERQKIEEAITKFKLVRERAPESPWSGHALFELGNAYYALGDYDEAENYLKESIKHTGMEASGSTALLAEIYLNRGKYEEALELTKKSLTEKPGYNPLEMMLLQGRALMAMEEWEAGRRVFEQIPGRAKVILGEHLADQGQEVVDSNVTDYSEVADRYLRRLQSLASGPEAVGSITGKVYIKGELAKDVRVYLVDKNLGEDSYLASARNLPKAVTSAEGEYSFTGLAPGNYELGVGVRPDDINGSAIQQLGNDTIVRAGATAFRDIRFVPTVKLKSPLAGATIGENARFQWEPVEGASRYELFIGPVSRDDRGNIITNYTTILKGDIHNNSVTINLKKDRSKLILNGTVAYSDGVNPESILGLLREGGEYTWGVYAYDEKGNRISDSAGIGYFGQKEIPLVKVKGEVSAADRLLLEKKYNEAIAAYKELLRNNPNDTHALLVLARLNQFGIEYGKANLAEAAKYYEKLLQVEDTPELRDTLAGVYFDVGAYQKANHLYKSTIGTPAESWATYFHLARISFITGRPAEARNQLAKAIRLEGGKYCRAYPVALALVIGEPGEALALARQVDEGERYTALLEQYIAKEYPYNKAARANIAAGKYDAAVQQLKTRNQHDMFIRGLLLYLIEGHTKRDEIKKNADQMQDELLAEIMKKMLL